MEHKTVLDETYQKTRGRRFGPIEVPIPETDRNFTAVHCRSMVGVVTDQFDDDEPRAVLALKQPDSDAGLYIQFTAEDCRMQASIFMRMAEVLDEGGGLS